jgi:hypothetical protein
VTQDLPEYNRTANFNIQTLPQSLYSDALQTATAVVTLLVGVCALVFTIVAWPNRKEVCISKIPTSRSFANEIQAYRIPPCKGYPIAHIVNHLFCVATLVLVFIQHGNSARFDVTTLLAQSRDSVADQDQPLITYSAGTFDLESWSCDLARFAPSNFNATCQLEMAERYLLIPLALLNLFCLCTGLIARHLDLKLEAIQNAEKLALKKRMSAWTGTTASPMSSSIISPSPEHPDHQWTP